MKQGLQRRLARPRKLVWERWVLRRCHRNDLPKRRLVNSLPRHLVSRHGYRGLARRRAVSLPARAGLCELLALLGAATYLFVPVCRYRSHGFLVRLAQDEVVLEVDSPLVQLQGADFRKTLRQTLPIGYKLMISCDGCMEK